MKTLAHSPAIVAALLARSASDPTLAWVEVVAPCCGRITVADTILDVRGVVGTIVAGGGYRRRADVDWLCDGCRQLLYADRTNPWTRSRLYSAVGAEPDVVRYWYAREVAEMAEAADYATTNEHRPDGVVEMILEQLPAGVDPHREAA